MVDATLARSLLAEVWNPKVFLVTGKVPVPVDADAI